MVKIAVLSAWAELQIQSKDKPYLFDIVSQHLERLAVMWLDALTAYAKVQFEPEAGDGNLIDEMILDSQLGSSKEFLLQVRCSSSLGLIPRFIGPAGYTLCLL
jgi:hypothetical protein